MPRHRHKDFRSGDLCEAMGILLLKGIAAVAEVARPEDVGIDAVGTLLRPGPDDLLVAEDSFFVQIKSSSKDHIDYDENGVCWLKELRLPFFIGSVDKKSSCMALYSTNRLAGFLISSRERATYRLHLQKTDTTSTPERTEIYIGPAIAKWTVSQLCDKEHIERLYRVIKAHIEVEEWNISYRPLAYFQAVFWTTNDERLRKVLESGRGPSDDELKRILVNVSPHVALMTTYCQSHQNREGLELLGKLVGFMKAAGVDLALEKPIQQMLGR